jgi:hypothetical protein
MDVVQIDSGSRERASVSDQLGATGAARTDLALDLHRGSSLVGGCAGCEADRRRLAEKRASTCSDRPGAAGAACANLALDLHGDLLSRGDVQGRAECVQPGETFALS